jgi:glucokinase
LLDSAPQVRTALRTIGIAAPSVVVNPGGMVTLSASLGWRNVPLKSLLEERFGYPVFVQNESDLGALAESLWGVGRRAACLVWLNVGPGIGSGIVIHGRLYQGAHHAAGEVGYMVPDVRCLKRVYDSFGCMETLGSGAAILEKARRAIRTGEKGLLAETLARTGALTTAHLFQAARLNDPLAVRLLNEMASYISLVIVGIVSVLDPDLIVLGQELATAYDLFLPRIETNIKDVVPNMPQIAPSGLKAEAIVQGAVALALQATEERIDLPQPAFREALTL